MKDSDVTREVWFKVNDKKRLREAAYLPCNWCHTSTNHKILACVEKTYTETYKIPGDPDGASSWWMDFCDILRCMGCDSLSARWVDGSTEDTIDDHENMTFEPNWQTQLFPKRQDRSKHQTFKYTHDLPREVNALYQEIHHALTNDMSTLAGIGIRALVEMVCKHQGAEGGDLKQKIDNLHTKGIVTAHLTKVLHHIRNWGNKAAHENDPGSPFTLSTAMEAVEQFLIHIYTTKRHEMLLKPESEPPKA